MINPEPLAPNQVPSEPTPPPSVQTTPPPENPPLKKPARWKRPLFIILVLLVAILGASFAWYMHVAGKVFVVGGGNTHGLLQSDPQNIDTASLKQPGDGRVNILVLGIGGVTDGGQVHDGADLTDSIQLLSFDTVNKKLSMTSVPRDFLVDIPGHGANKINAVYEDGETDSGTGAQGGGAAIKTEVGKILGVNISNFVVIDFTAAKEIVDTIGGIDVDVPKSIYDPAYPCDDQIHYCPFSISAGEHHMDGTVALEYMRTRHADSDFGRSARQQLVVSAIKQKALSVGVLSDPLKVINIINSLGSHIKTDLQPGDIQALVADFRNIPSSSITSNVMDTTTSLGLLKATTNPYAGDVEEPVDGLTAYGPIQQWFHKNNPDPFLAKENATITVANSGLATDTQMQAFVQKLQDYGFNAVLSTQAAPGSYVSHTTIYSSTNNKPVTTNYLTSVVGTAPIQGNPLNSGSNFEIIYAPSNSD